MYVEYNVLMEDDHGLFVKNYREREAGDAIRRARDGNPHAAVKLVTTINLRLIGEGKEAVICLEPRQ